MGKVLKMSQDSKFHILHVTDIHENFNEAKFGKISKGLLKALIRSENPDLLVITGDISAPDRIDQVMQIPEELGIPTAVTFGNHEPAYEKRRAYLDACRSYSCCVNPAPELPDSRCSTFFLPIRNLNDTATVYGLWFCDTAPDAEPDGGEYITREQIAWFESEHEKQRLANNGNPLPSLWFYHIVFPEIYDALIEVKPKTPRAMPCFLDQDRYFIPDENTMRAGVLNEMPCTLLKNYGMFDAIVNAGGIKACFSGHDHDNTFEITHRGIDLINSPKGCYRGSFNAFHGGRRITVDLQHPNTYTTEIIPYSSFYKGQLFKENKDILPSDAFSVLQVRKDAVHRRIEDIVTAEIPECFRKTFGYKEQHGERIWKAE